MSKKDVEIEKYCVYCEHSTLLYDEDYVLCQRKGVVSSLHKCRKFVYDPLKRKPAAPTISALEFINIDQ